MAKSVSVRDGSVGGSVAVVVTAVSGAESPRTDGCGVPGGDESDRNMLARPLVTTPGCMPKNGTSKLIVPRTRCRKALSPGGGRGSSSTSSADKSPPMECPRRIVSTSCDS